MRFTYGFTEPGRPAKPWGREVPPDAVKPADALVTYAANIFTPHHTTAMAATMQAAVRARSRTWTFIVSIPFSFATPHGRYAIPQHVGNFGFAERTGIEARPLLDDVRTKRDG
jgi:hypothetical protein